MVRDHLGSVRVVLDSGGAVLDRYDHEPFGNAIAVSGVVTGVRKGYIDKEKDVESGLYNLGARQLDGPRFLNVDRMWEKYPALSPFAYANNNPVNNADPSGDTIVYKLDQGTPEAYMKRTKDLMAMLAKKGGFIGDVIAYLENSTKVHTILVTFHKSSESYSNKPDAGDGTGSPTRIHFNPYYHEEFQKAAQANPALNKYAKEVGPDFICLAAELTHSYRADQGIQDLNP
ncbi:MAG TPA: RHS repeat-associated core domain-containing protein [Candidatus Kapabacteria bacterium]|nr:RHS repeat-associated core domain-containing protein [Candidatus Kapabacteria bacterium]